MCARYKNYHRSNDNFISTDNVVLDLDNERLDDPKDWIDMEDIEKMRLPIKMNIKN